MWRRELLRLRLATSKSADRPIRSAEFHEVIKFTVLITKSYTIMVADIQAPLRVKGLKWKVGGNRLEVVVFLTFTTASYRYTGDCPLLPWTALSLRMKREGLIPPHKIFSSLIDDDLNYPHLVLPSGASSFVIWVTFFFRERQLSEVVRFFHWTFWQPVSNVDSPLVLQHRSVATRKLH